MRDQLTPYEYMQHNYVYQFTHLPNNYYARQIFTVVYYIIMCGNY